MNIQDIILKKRDGGEMSAAEIDFLVKGIVDGSIPDYQTAAWAMAVYFRGMNDRETQTLALAMAYSGDIIDLSEIPGIKIDKHSSGGVGDKTTLVVVPLAAAAGVPMAKMSGRGLGHTGGTIDKLESIPGFRVERSHHQLIGQVKRVGAALVSQSGNLVPADKKLYAIRDVTATIDSIPLIASSIMSKKIAAGAQGIVLDVKVGRGAFMKDREGAHGLAQTMVEIGRGAGREVVALLTDMSQPLGESVGNALEVKEAIDLLLGQGPPDLEELSVLLTAHILVMAHKYSDLEQAKKQVENLLCSGAGFAKFCEMVAAQDGRLDFNQIGYGLPQAAYRIEVKSEEEGYITGLDALEVGHTAMLLGAGRQKMEEKIDLAVGVQVIKKVGEYVRPGDVLAVIHANRNEDLTAGGIRLRNCYCLDKEKPAVRPLVLETIR